MSKSSSKNKKATKTAKIRSIAQNRRARHTYLILQELECGIVLLGTEVKSLRGGRCSIVESFARIHDDGEMWLYSAHINEYEQGNRFNHEPTRPRKLLAHRKEIEKLAKELREKGTTLVPLEIYFDEALVKVRLGLGRGKKQFDKREDQKKRDAQRDMDRAQFRRR